MQFSDYMCLRSSIYAYICSEIGSYSCRKQEAKIHCLLLPMERMLGSLLTFIIVEISRLFPCVRPVMYVDIVFGCLGNFVSYKKLLVVVTMSTVESMPETLMASHSCQINGAVSVWKRRNCGIEFNKKKSAS